MCQASQQVLSHIVSFSLHNGSVLWSRVTDEETEAGTKERKGLPMSYSQ